MTKNIPTLILKFLRFALEISNLTLAMTHWSSALSWNSERILFVFINLVQDLKCHKDLRKAQKLPSDLSFHANYSTGIIFQSFQFVFWNMKVFESNKDIFGGAGVPKHVFHLKEAIKMVRNNDDFIESFIWQVWKVCDIFLNYYYCAQIVGLQNDSSFFSSFYQLLIKWMVCSLLLWNILECTFQWSHCNKVYKNRNNCFR